MPTEIALPSNPFARHVPDGGQQWNLKWAGHLVRRLGFGANADRLDAAVKAGPVKTINEMLDYDPANDPLSDMAEQLTGFVTFKELKQAQEWCFYRMLNTSRPAQEKLAMFWHNRFATSAAKVDSPGMMHNQIELFRQKGLGSFHELLTAVGKDPAMLVWLDGQFNRKGKPNENYGREVMELFTLGIGSYTEKDVKELARAFTGWQQYNGVGVFNPKLFDDGEKTIFGQSGNFDAEQSNKLLLGQPSAGPFLAKHMLAEFVHPHPTDLVINHYGKRLVETQWDLKAVLKEMVGSRLFFSDWAYRSRIKSPIDLAVGSVLALGGKVNTTFLRTQTAKMGQDVLQPPNVKGWDGDVDWINANTVMVRFNFGQELATQRNGEFARKSELEAWLVKHDIKTADDVVNHYAMLLLDGQLPDGARETFVGYMNHGPEKNPKPFSLEKDAFNDKLRGLIHLMMAMPEYQLA
jgi:uncharacterized protein (DUF1800 family)